MTKQGQAYIQWRTAPPCARRLAQLRTEDAFGFRNRLDGDRSVTSQGQPDADSCASYLTSSNQSRAKKIMALQLLKTDAQEPPIINARSRLHFSPHY